MMPSNSSYHLAMTAFHSAIDCEQENRNEDAYKKYVEGLALVSTILKNEANSLHELNVVKKHRHVVEFAKRSADRLLMILEKLESERAPIDRIDDGEPSSAYRVMSQTLPGIHTNAPTMSFSFIRDVNNALSPLSTLEEDKQRIRRNYERIIDSLLDVRAKTNLRLELERKLAENDAVARERYARWEEERKALAAECHKIAEQKFSIRDRLEMGTANESDFTKQNLYAACLQYHKENKWAQDASCKLYAQQDDANFVRKIISVVLRHESHPLAYMLRQIQRKALNKLSNVHSSQITTNKCERTTMGEHFKSIVNDIKDDLFTLTTVIQALWESLANETNQLIVIDVLHHLYFPPIKPYLFNILSVVLFDQKKQLSDSMTKYDERIPANLAPILCELHQLTSMHSPTTMMSLLVETLRAFVNTSCNKGALDETTLLSISIDDIMPKLIHLILISRMPNLVVEITFIENFMPAKRALGEEGYAVTLIQSILSYICANSASLEPSAP